jgi:hypothetical protein
LRSWKWQESCKRDREEEVVLAGGCLSSAKLRSTDSVNPRAVLSRVLPRYRLYSKHRDRRCWTGPGIGIRVSFRTYENRLRFGIGTEECDWVEAFAP